jgi:hypothetical protein
MRGVLTKGKVIRSGFGKDKAAGLFAGSLLAMFGKSLLLCSALLTPAMTQTPHMPNTETQREAMKKLSFLIGSWRGEARQYRGTAPVELIQTEVAQYKLDGLILVIEGVGRTKSDGKATLQAYGLVSYDDATGAYHMRAFNDGLWLETDVKLADNGKGLSWGFVFGEIKTRSSLQITESGEWTEQHEITVGSAAPRKLMEIAVRLQE